MKYVKLVATAVKSKLYREHLGYKVGPKLRELAPHGQSRRDSRNLGPNLWPMSVNVEQGEHFLPQLCFLGPLGL